MKSLTRAAHPLKGPWIASLVSIVSVALAYGLTMLSGRLAIQALGLSETLGMVTGGLLGMAAAVLCMKLVRRFFRPSLWITAIGALCAVGLIGDLAATAVGEKLEPDDPTRLVPFWIVTLGMPIGFGICLALNAKAIEKHQT